MSDFDKPAQEWVMQLSDFVAKTIHSEVSTDPLPKQPWMVRRQFECLLVQPMKLFSGKVIMYPDMHNNDECLSIDSDRPVEIHEVGFPKVNEVMNFRSVTQT